MTDHEYYAHNLQLLLAARWMQGNAAEAAFRGGLRRTPRDGRMLFGLLESLKAQGKGDAAAWVQREYEAAWRKSDLKLRVDDL